MKSGKRTASRIDRHFNLGLPRYFTGRPRSQSATGLIHDNLIVAVSRNNVNTVGITGSGVSGDSHVVEQQCTIGCNGNLNHIVVAITGNGQHAGSEIRVARKQKPLLKNLKIEQSLFFRCGYYFPMKQSSQGNKVLI